MNHHLGDQFAVLSLFYDIDYIYFLYQKVYKLRTLENENCVFFKKQFITNFFWNHVSFNFLFNLKCFFNHDLNQRLLNGVFFQYKIRFSNSGAWKPKCYFKLIFNNFKYTCMYDCVENEDFNNKLFLKYSFHNVPFRLKSKTNLKLCFFMK